MRHFLESIGRYPTGLTPEAPRLELELRRARRTARVLNRVAMILIGGALCALAAYIFAEACFGSGSIVQFPINK